jgi:hypothetical protein
MNGIEFPLDYLFDMEKVYKLHNWLDMDVGKTTKQIS